MTTRFMLTQGILISTLTLGFGLVACSSDDAKPGATGAGGKGYTDDAGDGTGGKSTSSGGSSSGGKSGGDGGKATGTGGAKTDGGSEYDSGKPETDAGAPTCAEYCADSLEYCVPGDGGDHEGYFQSEADCLAACALYPTTGKAGDASGNTLQCRMTHLGFVEAAADPVAYAKLHCPHTGVYPTAFCK